MRNITTLANNNFEFNTWLAKQRIKTVIFRHLFMSWASNFLWQRAMPFIIGWFVGHMWKNSNKWCTRLPKIIVIFIVYTQFTDVAAGHKIQPGRLWVGDLRFLCSARWQKRDGIYTVVALWFPVWQEEWGVHFCLAANTSCMCAWTDLCRSNAVDTYSGHAYIWILAGLW